MKVCGVYGALKSWDTVFILFVHKLSWSNLQPRLCPLVHRLDIYSSSREPNRKISADMLITFDIYSSSREPNRKISADVLITQLVV